MAVVEQNLLGKASKKIVKLNPTFLVKSDIFYSKTKHLFFFINGQSSAIFVLQIFLGESESCSVDTGHARIPLSGFGFCQK